MVSSASWAQDDMPLENDRKSESSDHALVIRISQLHLKFLSCVVIFYMAYTYLLSPMNRAQLDVSRLLRNETVDRRVARILKHHPLVDTHIDLPELARWQFRNKINGDDFNFNKKGFVGHLDIPRLRQGGIGGAFWSVYTDCPSDWNDTKAVGTLLQTRQTLQQIDVAQRIVAKYPKHMEMASSVHEFLKVFKAGKIPGVLGAEGLHQIGNSIAALRQYHALGVRYMTLTHFCNNRFADSCSVEPWHDGLSVAGVRVVHEMNRLGMMVDLSHTSDETMRAALDTTMAPVIFSHSGAQGVFEHERNAPDDVLMKLAENGGVINVVFMPEYLGPDYTKVDIDTVVDHILYIVKLVGWSHVGIGSDFDGVEHLPKGLNSVADYPALITRVIERSKATDKDIVGFIGGNVLRVWSEVEQVANTLQRKGVKPYEIDEL